VVVDGLSGGEEGAMVVKAILVKDGTETCIIGFLPMHIVHRGMTTIKRFMGKFTQIIDLYDLCNDSMAKKTRAPGIKAWHHLVCKMTFKRGRRM